MAAPFVKPAAWTNSDPTVVTITPSPDGASCRVEAAVPAKLGTATVTATDPNLPALPPVVFDITVGPEAVTHLGVAVEPAAARP